MKDEHTLRGRMRRMTSVGEGLWVQRAHYQSPSDSALDKIRKNLRDAGVILKLTEEKK